MQQLQIAQEYQRNGFCTIQGYYKAEYIAAVATELASAGVFDYGADNRDDYNLLHQIEAVRQLANDSGLLLMVSEAIGTPATPYDAIVLDKSTENNWTLDWHQDLKIAVKERIDTEGYSLWTEEAGIPHVVPPAAVLEKLLYLRVHLDDCDISNGAIWVLPQSHQEGIIAQAAVPNVVKQYATMQACTVAAGGLVLLSPLVLHQSPHSQSHKRRRVLQIAYRATELHNGLRWYY